MAAYQPGQSGNPRGRPKSHLGCQKLRDLISEHAEKIVKRLIMAAVNEGDTAAAKLLLERALPAIKPIELPIKLPIPNDAGLADQGRAIIAALASGKIPPGQASQLLSGLGALSKLIELEELTRRIEKLEEQSQ